MLWLGDFATVQDAPQQDSTDAFVPPIRKRLRQWEADNKLPMPRAMPSDNGPAGQPRNTLTRARIPDDLEVAGQEPRSELDQPLPDRDGSLETLSPPTDFKAGDLIEMYEDGDRVALLAVCLGHFNDMYHFYTATGKWHPTPRVSTHFIVKNFVEEKELEPVLAKLPEELTPETLQAVKQLKLGPDRTSGAGLLKKMAKFKELTEVVLQKYATRFENAHETLAQSDERYFTLEQIASRLMSKNGLPNTNPVIPPTTLYAVHRTVVGDDVGFKLLGNLGNSRTWLYEITSPEDVSLINNMQTLVRLFTDTPGKVGTPLSDLTSSQLSESQLGRFILKAREAIDQSRQSREWTPHGVLGPATRSRRPASTNWSGVDLRVLHFMHLWAGYNQFALSSRFHWIGSAILRATARYKDSEYLSMTTGWTFLQEIGYITPWDIRARYTRRLPGVTPSRESGYTRITLGPGGVSTYFTPDPFIGKRKEWTGHRVFAIDSKDTVDIDDAVSIEATETPGEHWVHVHVADPASRIRPQSALGKRAQLVPLNLYLSGHDSNIWGVGNEVQKLFSLGPNAPCLTFSGKLNEQGRLLEYKITPGKLHDYIYMTPAEANAAVGFEEPRQPPKWSAAENFVVGKLPANKAENRKMTSAAELQPEDLESLKTLYRLGHALRQRRLAKGAMPVFPLRPNAKAYFNETSMKEVPPGLIDSDGDPTINISWDQGGESPMVSNTMTLAGEIAARWCSDRKIPIPYVTQPNAARNLEQLKPYSETVYSILLRGEEPTPEQSAHLQRLMGADDMSTRPGSHFLMGLDCYAKVTSPLRRYSDLVAHWQIESALAQEAETGKVAEQKLPFSRAELDKEVFPWLRLRQRVIRRLGSWVGNQAYMLQALVRAWKFPAEGDSRLPETFKFKVVAEAGGRKVILGSLDWFGLKARMLPDGLGDLGLRVADIRGGDVFEVKLKDVNVHQDDVFVEVVGKVRVQADAVPAPVLEEVVAKAKL
ncbi:hypothetical protein VPNG_03769 [Cytospora leucostoma]|uniref:RNB domain-containing protein n=1 Tax=Cytospora leucostoma TaxID=1230097 RepID=A0A423XEV2_9PEZI|nr:hypothetical protein VPNG_03769 [Cytospora leucostoma]